MVDRNVPDRTNVPIQHQREFSDRIQGEDLEFHSRATRDFPVTHKIERLREIPPPSFLTNLSATQLVTLSGAASGFLAGVVVCPLDVVKTRLQAKGAATIIQGRQRYHGFIGEFRNIIAEEGFRGLYRGLVPITIGYLPTWTIYFTIYEKAKGFYPQFMDKNFGLNIDSLNHFCAALTAGLASSIAVNPIWVVKTRLMTQVAKPKDSINKKQHYYKGTFDAFKTMYREEGFRVFYSGLVPSLFGLLHVGIHFPVYEKLKHLTGCNVATTSSHSQFEDNNNSSSNSAAAAEGIDFTNGPSHLLWRLIFASSLAKMIASTITYPHEILRTRMQIRTKQNCIDQDGIIKAISKIYRKEGWKGFYAGYVVNLARTVPASAITLVSFEYFKTYLLEISGKTL